MTARGRFGSPPSVPRLVGTVRARWQRMANRADRGAATVEFVIAVPVLMLMLLFVPQAAVWYHATHVAQAAANRALDAGAAYDGSAAQGEEAGEQTLATLARDRPPMTCASIARCLN